MKSSSRRDLSALGLLTAGALLIGSLRPRLADEFSRLNDSPDAYLLPSADQAYVASLGYRSALADLVYGHVLVSYGLHFQDNRLFVHVGDYLDLINRLDPKFRAPYWFADTLLTLQAQAPPQEFYRKARTIQERGLKELPHDQLLWSTAGQFLAYLAPQQLSDPEEKQEYKRTGAKYLMRACDLVGTNEAIPHHCITAARLLTADGNLAAAQRFLERLQAVTDDPAIQSLASSYLRRTVGDGARMVAAERQARFRAKWHGDLALSPRVEIGALGPGFDAAHCAGPKPSLLAECVTSWRHWAELEDASNGS